MSDDSETSAIHRSTGRCVHVALGLVALTMTLSACSSSNGRRIAPESSLETVSTTSPTVSKVTVQPTTSTLSTTATASDGSSSQVGFTVYEAGKTVVASVLPDVASVDVYDAADATVASSTLSNPVRKGTPRVFVVEGRTPDRLLVQLPVRPNGSKGWIDADTVRLVSHEFLVTVELSAFRITVTSGVDVVLKAPIAIGQDNVPSPSGTYYITDLLKPPNPKSVYGTYAYGLSGFSDVLRSFNGGVGQVGIHGTNDPSSIGRRASHGCIRLQNADIEKLVPILPLGTPVRIVA